MKLKKKIKNKQKEDTKKLRGSTFNIRLQAKTEEKYFISNMKITDIVIF